MPRFFLPLFIALAIGGTAFIIATAGDLPVQVAPHFGRGDQANAWTPRDTYVAIMVGAATLLPLLLVHWVVVAADTSVPTQLPDRPFQALIAGFFAAMCVWTVALCLRFRRPG